MRIGEISQRSAVAPRMLRYYEAQGLLQPGRHPNGYRDYPPEALARLQFIRRSKAAGLSLAEIRNILQIRDAGQAPCAHVAAQLAQQLTDLDQHIAELTALRASAAEHYQAASQGDPTQCDPAQICSYL